MYNTNIPTRAELPTTAQLFRSTLIASLIAATALVTVVMPAEYAVDPTGMGGLLGLTNMGEIKTSLAAEARADELASKTPPAPIDVAQLNRIEERLGSLEKSLKDFLEVNALGTSDGPAKQAAVEEPIVPLALEQAIETSSASAEQVSENTDAITTAAVSDDRTDEMEITFRPGEAAEVKLTMNSGEVAEYSWSANGGRLNFDVHGEGENEKASYDKGRMVPEYKGTIEAAFDGKHGWFWRNRTEADVTMSLRTKGAYSDIVRVK